MVGGLLPWMQAHASLAIMVATVNHIEMLPPELIRRFEYSWFFDSYLHNGAIFEVFSLHIKKHFPELVDREFLDFVSPLDRSQWSDIFANYYSCSPAEIGLATTKAHQELLCENLLENLTPELLISTLLAVRKDFKPAIENQNTSDALARMRRSCSFAKPARGPDTSPFATSKRGMFDNQLSL